MGSLPPPKPFTIAIVGGGIGGITLAIGLAAQGIPFHIYESAPSFGEIGAGVSFGPNVIRAMHSISPALLRAYAKHVTCNEDPELADQMFTFRRGDFGPDMVHVAVDLDGKRCASPPPPPPEALFESSFTAQEIDGLRFPVRCCVHRAHFLDEIVQLLPAQTTTFSKALVRLEEDATGEHDGNVRLHFADGSVATASAVIGCDGIRSVTRKHLHGPDAGPEYSGDFAYRAMAPRAEFERVLGREIATTGNLFVSSNGYCIAYPVDHGAALNMVAIRMRPEHTTWGHREWKVKAKPGQVAGDLQGRHPGLLELFARHGDGDKWAMFHSPHRQAYFRDRICLLGDAAHASTPHLGAGAGMAIEDSAVLTQLLAAVASAPELMHAFSAYDAVRRSRSQGVIRSSSENLSRLRRIATAEGEELVRLQEETYRQFGQIGNFDLQESLDSAMSMFHNSRNSVPLADRGVIVP
jgi:salicylate hydroxylase